MSKSLVVAAAMIASLAAVPAMSEDVHASVDFDPPPVFVTSPPPLVIVPGSPVYYAPGYDFSLFFYRGRYYTQFNDAWFWAPRVGAAWLAVSDVPKPLLKVPVEYHRAQGKPVHCPPGQAKKGRC
jgi:hypothetical protein